MKTGLLTENNENDVSIKTTDQRNKAETNRDLTRKIVIGSLLLSLHKQQGTVPYLIQMVEPYLKKADRQLFGLPF